MPLVMKAGLTTDVERIVLSFTGPASYATGGFDPGFPTGGAPVYGFGYSLADGKTTGYVAMIDITNKKVKVFQAQAGPNPLIEIPNATNISTFTFIIDAIWKP